MSTRKFYLLILLVVFLQIAIFCKAGSISDSTINVIAGRFIKMKYKLEKKLTPEIDNTTIKIPRGDVISCLTGKEVLIVAVFDNKPGDFFGRMLVSKKYNGKIEYDKHMFQDIGYDVVTEVYYAMINVLFPEESNNLNCQATLQVYDKKHQVKDIRVLVFTK